MTGTTALPAPLWGVYAEALSLVRPNRNHHYFSWKTEASTLVFPGFTLILCGVYADAINVVRPSFKH
jgi:hypothetical protein